MNDIVILSAARTPIGSFQGTLASVPSPRLGAAAMQAAMAQAGVAPDEITDVLMGNVLQAGAGQAPARQAALQAGLSVNTRCGTVNKVLRQSHYRAFTDRSHWTMAGLSMGGMQTHSTTMADLDTFAYIALFSGRTISTDDVTNVAGFKKKVQVLFMSCGSKESPAGVQSSHDALEQIGIKSTIYVSPDAAHEWPAWRESLIVEPGMCPS